MGGSTSQAVAQKPQEDGAPDPHGEAGL